MYIIKGYIEKQHFETNGLEFLCVFSTNSTCINSSFELVTAFEGGIIVILTFCKHMIRFQDYFYLSL
jgi:hypothetical protein